MSEHFIILGLPRSMTAWVSCFLTCGDVFCQHEIYPKVSHDDAAHEAAELIRSQPFPVSGVCDPGLLPYWEGLAEEFPEATFIFIHRPVGAVAESLNNIGIKAKQAWEMARRMYEIGRKFTRSPDCLYEFDFDKIQTEEGARQLWDCVAPTVPLPPAHLAKMLTLKVVVHPEVYAEAVQVLNSLTT